MHEADALTLLASLLGLVVFLGTWELARHLRHLRAIPARVHVNGTRGKSSVTRLIGAGLRAGGLRTLVKVTGTFPKMVLEDGSEIDIYRRGGANILEQLDIMRFAARRRAQALVIECMAVEPRLQWVTEHRIVRSTLSVLTNVRLDHTEVMGRTRQEIAAALGGTIPRRGLLISGEREMAGEVARLARRRETDVLVTDPVAVSRAQMERFSYLEHEENVALALAVCERLGVNRRIALDGMVAATPDAGALTRTLLRHQGTTLRLFNAFAANDADSTLRIWRRLEEEGRLAGRRVVLLNTREDRWDRSRQLAELITEELSEGVDELVLMGTGTHAAVAALGPWKHCRDLGAASAEEVFDALLELCRPFPEVTVVAIGNMGGAGAELVAHCQHAASAAVGRPA